MEQFMYTLYDEEDLDIAEEGFVSNIKNGFVETLKKLCKKVLERWKIVKKFISTKFKNMVRNIKKEKLVQYLPFLKGFNKVAKNAAKSKENYSVEDIKVCLGDSTYSITEAASSESDDSEVDITALLKEVEDSLDESIAMRASRDEDGENINVKNVGMLSDNMEKLKLKTENIKNVDELFDSAEKEFTEAVNNMNTMARKAEAEVNPFEEMIKNLEEKRASHANFFDAKDGELTELQKKNQKFSEEFEKERAEMKARQKYAESKEGIRKENIALFANAIGRMALTISMVIVITKVVKRCG